MIAFTGCKKWLDVNSDPDTPQQPSGGSVLPQIQASMAASLQSDGGLYVAKYIQNWLTNAASNNNTYDLQGYVFGGGTMASAWGMIYNAFGLNLEYILENSTKNKQNDYMGAALALKAWSYQYGTDYFSDLPFYDAYKPDTYKFKYETQESIYRLVDSMCKDALVYLRAADGDPTNTLAKGDLVYGGDIKKWKRFVFGVLARNRNHLSAKSIYSADSVISYCDSALASVTDDYCVPFDATFNDNSNYFGPYRDNMPALRQSNFIVHLLDGTILCDSTVSHKINRDPRLAHMLTCSHDTTNGNGGYRGVDPGAGDPFSALNPPESYYVNGQPPTSGTALTNYNNARKKVSIAFGDSLYVNPSKGSFGSQGKFLFKNKSVFPIMTAAEIQFIKAEAALRKGDPGLAHIAYQNGIRLHFDFINRDYTSARGSFSLYNINPIQQSAITAYMNGKNVKQSPATLTLSDIMLQKYIALWGWGFVETWVDFRRNGFYDPADNVAFGVFTSIYKGLYGGTITLAGNNKGKCVQRVRPHYTSENTYNLEEITRLGILQTDWHVQKMWFSEP